MKPRTLVLGMVSLVVLATGAPAEIVERVVARVNGDIVTLSEFEARQVQVVQAARVSPDRIEAFLRENNARILQEAVDELLIVQRAADLRMKVPPEYLKEVVENIKKENNISNDQDLQAQLRREGMSLDDLKRNVERSILLRQVIARELESKITISEADARAEYEARKAEYTKVPSVHLQEILIRDDEGDARKRAREIVTRARAGEDFAALAQEHSAAPTRISGGDLGTLSRGEMNPEIEKVAFALAAGAVSDPFPSGDGYRILKVVEKTEGHVVPFEQVKAEIIRRLTQERMGQERERYVEGLRKTASIEVRVREVPLQLNLPQTPSTLLEPPPADTGPSPAKAVPGAAAPEFSTTPQAQPERVGPQPLPGELPGVPRKEDIPKPVPTPSPSPPPR